jgi:hypothetical protein
MAMTQSEYDRRVIEAQTQAGDAIHDSALFLSMMQINLALMGLMIVYGDVKPSHLHYCRWMGDADNEGKPGYIVPAS